MKQAGQAFGGDIVGRAARRNRAVVSSSLRASPPACSLSVSLSLELARAASSCARCTAFSKIFRRDRASAISIANRLASSCSNSSKDSTASLEDGGFAVSRGSAVTVKMLRGSLQPVRTSTSNFFAQAVAITAKVTIAARSSGVWVAVASAFTNKDNQRGKAWVGKEGGEGSCNGIGGSQDSAREALSLSGWAAVSCPARRCLRSGPGAGPRFRRFRDR